MGIFSSKQEPKDPFEENITEEAAFSESLGTDNADIEAIASPLDIKLQEKLRSLVSD